MPKSNRQNIRAAGLAGNRASDYDQFGQCALSGKG